MQRFECRGFFSGILMYSFFWVCCGKQLHWWTGCWQVLYPFHAKEPSRCCIVWSQVEKMNCYLQVMTTVWRDGTSGHLSITSSPTCCSLIASHLISFMNEEYLTIGKAFLLLVLNMLYNDSAFCTSKAQFRFPKLITYAAPNFAKPGAVWNLPSRSPCTTEALLRNQRDPPLASYMGHTSCVGGTQLRKFFWSGILFGFKGQLLKDICKRLQKILSFAQVKGLTTDGLILRWEA